MRKYVILTCVLLVITLLFTIMAYFFTDDFSYGFDYDSSYRTYTTAFCSGQTCRDFVVSCSGKDVVSLKPISGFVSFGDGWVDLRDERELC